MLSSDKQLFLEETEIRPNRYARLVLIATSLVTLISLILTEMGIFRVGLTEMRIGAAITIIVSAVPIILVTVNKKNLADHRIKYVMISAGIIFTLVVTTLLSFHTTILILFPIFMAMLYRSRKVGIIAAISTLFCSLFSTIIAYLLHAWDVPLFQELIYIATNVNVDIPNPTDEITLLSVGKIILYLGMPRLMLAGACCIILFKNIELGVDYVKNQILINQSSHRDNLTGLYNRNFYDKLIKTDDIKGEIGVIFFDVNNLKEMNDEFGHEFGDLLLKRCAQSILEICDDDTVHGFRMGGDEFLVICEGAHEPELLRKQADWIAALNKINIENQSSYEKIYCSMASGYAFGDFLNIEAIVAKADERMYTNKEVMKREANK